jgi:integrase
LIATVAYTGVRAGEALALHMADLDLAGRTIYLTTHGTSMKTTAAAAPVIAPPALVPILSDWLPHRCSRPRDVPTPPLDQIPWLFPGTHLTNYWHGGAQGFRPVDRLQKVAARAGVEPCTFQMLRRSWASISEARGTPQNLISRQLRHMSVDMSKKFYQELDLDALRAATEGFDFT